MGRLEANMGRLEASLSRERQQRIYHDQQFAQWVSKVTDLLVLQSSRLDSAQEQHQQNLVRLDRILEMLIRKGG
jgi:anti-sigma-K factor RskA